MLQIKFVKIKYIDISYSAKVTDFNLIKKLIKKLEFLN